MTQLRAFVAASIAFHQACAGILEGLNESLGDIVSSVGPRQKRAPKIVASYDDDDDDLPAAPKAAPPKAGTCHFHS